MRDCVQSLLKLFLIAQFYQLLEPPVLPLEHFGTKICLERLGGPNQGVSSNWLFWPFHTPLNSTLYIFW